MSVLDQSEPHGPNPGTLWQIRPDTIYLNHGSFGPTPIPARQAREQWQTRIAANPMDFFVRQWAGELENVLAALGEFVGAAAEDLALVDNATYGMNVVANSFPLVDGDEVLLTNHAYGAVERIWQRRCDITGAHLVKVRLPDPMESVDQVVDAIRKSFTDRTRMFVFSHITSATAVTLPAAEIVQLAKAHDIVTCIDGPHALAQLPLNLAAMDCDFYTASCHKWLSAPLGTGFLYVHPRWSQHIQPPILSWGKQVEDDAPPRWTDEFGWPGTCDPSAFLAIPVAIEMLRRIGLSHFREHTHGLAAYAHECLKQFAPRTPIVPDDPQWYGAMAHVPLPKCDTRKLQNALWAQYGIEVPIIDFDDQCWIRVSCHMYTQKSHIDQLIAALRELL